jgi:hypothetical protein
MTRIFSTPTIAAQPRTLASTLASTAPATPAAPAEMAGQ